MWHTFGLQKCRLCPRLILYYPCCIILLSDRVIQSTHTSPPQCGSGLTVWGYCATVTGVSLRTFKSSQAAAQEPSRKTNESRWDYTDPVSPRRHHHLSCHRCRSIRKGNDDAHQTVALPPTSAWVCWFKYLDCRPNQFASLIILTGLALGCEILMPNGGLQCRRSKKYHKWSKGKKRKQAKPKGWRDN